MRISSIECGRVVAILAVMTIHLSPFSNPFDPALWDALVEMGIPAMTLPEEVGGGAASLATLGIALEECGAALATAPVVETVVAARALARLGATEQAAAVVEGAVATASPRPGTSLLAGAATSVGAVVLDGDELVWVTPPDGGWAPVRAMSSIGLADVTDHGSRTVLARGDEARAAHDLLADEWRALTAAWLVGLAQRALDIGVQYATERHQFGVPIGSFQAVKHLLADMFVRAGLAQSAAYAAAAVVQAPGVDDPWRAARGAKLLAGEAALANASTAIQVLGGMGFTWDMLPNHLLKRAWVLEHAFGEADAHAAALGARLVDALP